MKRKITAREWMLLGVLFILAAVSGYIMLFYMPVTSARDSALSKTEACELLIDTAQIQLAEKQRMERELEEIFARDPEPLGLADYDNLQPVMVELNTILASAQNYSLSFATVDASKSIVRREISVNFTCGGYDTAKGILRQLHDSLYRCMLNNITVSLGRGNDGSVSVNGSIVYFECQTA